MIDTIYIEEEIANHPRTLAILKRFPEATKISCQRYGEVFNQQITKLQVTKKTTGVNSGKRNIKVSHYLHLKNTPSAQNIIIIFHTC